MLKNIEKEEKKKKKERIWLRKIQDSSISLCVYYPHSTCKTSFEKEKVEGESEREKKNTGTNHNLGI